MQGELSELDIRSILQLIELGQRTGELYVTARGLPSVVMSEASPADIAWLAFFDKGRLVYAGPTHGQLNRLRDHLRGQGFSTQSLAELVGDTMAELAAFNAIEYGVLWTLLERHRLTPQQGRSILERLVAETLFELLSLHHGTFVFRLG